MDLFNIDIVNKNISIRERISKGAFACVPVIIIGALLLSSAYITDIIFTGKIELSIGETVPVAKILYGTGTVINRLISPLVSGAVALFIGGVPALAGGLIGGMLTGMGVTYYFSSGNTSAVTGIYGSILVGLIAGYSIRLFSNLSKLTLKKPSDIPSYILPGIAVLASCSTVFIIDALAQIINSLSAILLAAVGEFSKPLLCILLGVMITADIGGPLYLSALVYSVASIATNESVIMASITAAGCVPVLSIFFATIVYKNKFTKKERSYSRLSIPCALCGINQVAIPFYATYLHRIILPSVAGGCVSSLLCLLFDCKALFPQGGFLSITGSGSFLLFTLSVLCGVLICTALIGLLLEDKENTSEEAVKSYSATALPYGL